MCQLSKNPVTGKNCQQHKLFQLTLLQKEPTIHHLFWHKFWMLRKFPTSLMKRKQSRCRSFCFAVKKNKHLGQLTFQQEQTKTRSFAHFIKIITENYNRAECKRKTHRKYNMKQVKASYKFYMRSRWATPDSRSHMQSFFLWLTRSKSLETNGSINLLKRRWIIKTTSSLQPKKIKVSVWQGS